MGLTGQNISAALDRLVAGMTGLKHSGVGTRSVQNPALSSNGP